jgi:FlaG/FlaF family flagellin (archaellin)
MVIKNKKAVSPMVSTVLLIMIVIIMAIIILLWSRGFIKESILKEIGGESKRVEQFCPEVAMTPILNSDGSFGFTNNGNVPIYALNLKLTSSGDSDTIDIRPTQGGLVNPGFATLIDPNTYDYYNYDEVEIIPVLLGKTKTGAVKEKACDDIYALKI